jgi:hypothetical protein
VLVRHDDRVHGRQGHPRRRRERILRTKTRSAILLEVMGPEGDTNSGHDKGTLEVVLGING